MSSLTSLKVFGSLTALAMLGGCATTPAQPAAETQTAKLSKPSPEEIETIARADALTQATFWNDYYNAYPGDLDISVAFVKSLRAINSHDRAVEVAKTTSIKFPNEPAIALELGRAHAGLGHLVEAVAAYEKTTKLAPFDATPYAAMAILYDSHNQHERAQIAYRRAIALDPNRPVTLSNLGLSLALSGDVEEAEFALRQATALPGATTAVRQNLALVLGLQGKFDEAREIAEIDAPEGVAKKNTEFLRQMIGNNVQLSTLAHGSPSSRSDYQPAAPAEVPTAAPTQTVASGPIQLSEEEPISDISTLQLRSRKRSDSK